MCGCKKKRNMMVPADSRSAGDAVAIELLEIPPTSVWGPLMWKILHITAHNSGKMGNITEKNTWLKILDVLKNIIPCDECRTHYKNYINSHKFRPNTSSPVAFREYVMRWFWEFHNAVNVSLEKLTFTYDDMVAVYANMTIGDYITAYEQLVPIFIENSLIHMSSWTIFKATIMRLN